jgi:hypothetical protein
MFGVSAEDIKIALPQKPRGIKKYNGVDWWYWLIDPFPGTAAIFCRCNYTGDAHIGTASSVGGCAPAFCVA